MLDICTGSAEIYGQLSMRRATLQVKSRQPRLAGPKAQALMSEPTREEKEMAMTARKNLLVPSLLRSIDFGQLLRSRRPRRVPIAVPVRGRPSGSRRANEAGSDRVRPSGPGWQR